MKSRYVVFGILALCLIVLINLWSRSAPKMEVYNFPAFGTVLSATLPQGEQSEKAMGEIRELCRELNEVLNVYNPQSELSILNRTAHESPCVCSPRLWEIFCEAWAAWQETHGAFDVTVGPLMALWGFRKGERTLEKVPTAEQIAEVLQHVGMDKLVVDREKRAISFRVAGMAMDFGGIAKGFALKKSKEILIAHGITQGMLNFGGNLYVLENPQTSHGAYRVALRDPIGRKAAGVICQLKNQAVATSGSYENFVLINGKPHSHIIDPKTGWPIENRISVSVWCQDPLDSDIFSTAVFVGGEAIFNVLKKRDVTAGMHDYKMDGATYDN